MSDYLSDEEQVARLQSWWRAYGLLTIIGLVLAIALVVGWRWYQAREAAAVVAASALFDEYKAADDSSRQGVLNQLLGDHPNSTYTGFARMDAAQRKVTAGDLAAGIEQYQALVGSGLDSDIKDLANLRLARLLQQQGEAEAALAALAVVRGTGFRSQVAELKGDILFQQGDQAGAHEAYAAALAAVPAGSERPILKMKENNTATPDDGRRPAATETVPIAELEDKPEPVSSTVLETETETETGDGVDAVAGTPAKAATEPAAEPTQN